MKNQKETNIVTIAQSLSNQRKNEKPVSHVTKVTLGKMKTHSCHENENPRGTQMCGEEVFLQVVTFSYTHSRCARKVHRASDSARHFKNTAPSAHLLAT